MSDRLKMLREKRGAALAQMKAIIDRSTAEKRDLTAAEFAKHDELYTSVNELGTQIDAEVEVIERVREDAMRNLPVDFGGPQELRDARSAMAYFARTGNESRFKALDRRSMSAGSDPDGGYVVVPALSKSMTSRIFDQSPIYGMARIIDLEYPLRPLAGRSRR
jgi:HK97 family phage major capsid protein